MAEHLGQRQVRLRDGDVAPQRLRDLVRGARAARRSAGGSSRRAGGAARSARRSASRWSVIGSPWPGSTSSTSISRVCSQRAQVGDERLRALARSRRRRPGDQRVRGDVAEQVVGRRAACAARGRGRSCRSGCGPGRWCTWSVAVAERELVAVVQHARHVGAGAPGAERLRHRAAARCTTSSEMPLRSITARANSSSLLRPPRSSSRRTAPPASIAATSAPERSATSDTSPRWSMCWWVRITSSMSSSEWPSSASPCVQLVERRGRSSGPASTSVSGSSSIR